MSCTVHNACTYITICTVCESTTYSLTDSLQMGDLQFDGREGCGECWDADISCG